MTEGKSCDNCLYGLRTRDNRFGCLYSGVCNREERTAWRSGSVVDKSAETLGRKFAPQVTFQVVQNEERGRWMASFSMGDLYFETDPYKEKNGALSELLGYIRGLKENYEEEINKLENEIETL